MSKHWFEPYVYSFLLCKTKTVKKVSITDEIIALLICVFVLPVFRGHRCLLSHLYEQKMVGRSSAPGKLDNLNFICMLMVDDDEMLMLRPGTTSVWELSMTAGKEGSWSVQKVITITINTVLTITITIIIITINHSYHYHYLPSPGHHQHRFASNTLCHLV